MYEDQKAIERTENLTILLCVAALLTLVVLALTGNL